MAMERRHQCSSCQQVADKVVNDSDSKESANDPFDISVYIIFYLKKTKQK